jgi:hypothetical protein
VLIPVWTPAARTDSLPVHVGSHTAVLLACIASLVLGLYPTTLLLAGQLGAAPVRLP